MLETHVCAMNVRLILPWFLKALQTSASTENIPKSCGSQGYSNKTKLLCGKIPTFITHVHLMALMFIGNNLREQQKQQQTVKKTKKKKLKKDNNVEQILQAMNSSNKNKPITPEQKMLLFYSLSLPYFFLSFNLNASVLRESRKCCFCVSFFWLLE